MSPDLLELVKSIRNLTRSTLLFQSGAAMSIGLNVTDAECLDYLMERGSATAGELAKLTGLTTGAITSVIDRLEKSGFAARGTDPKDRRKVIVRFVPGNEKKATAIYGEMAKDVISMLSRFDEEELGILKKFTQNLTEIYQQHTLKITHQ